MAWEIIGVWNFVSQYEKSNSKESSSLVGRIFFLKCKAKLLFGFSECKNKNQEFSFGRVKSLSHYRRL